jgi:rhodanese-related sulfurtransferase
MSQENSSDGCVLTFQQRSLVQQGYKNFSQKELKELEWGLRFTPSVCAMIALYGLVTAQPMVLFFVAAMGYWAFWAPAAHPMDLLYNHVVRKLLGAAKLPPNPIQRRLACLSAAVMNTASGAFFLIGTPTFAYCMGGTLLFFQVIVIFTHFCALSWMYERATKILGSWKGPLSEEEAHQFLASGAKVIDVRSPPEFAEKHLDGVLNFPLETLQNNLDALPKGVLLLHCKSGMRSNMAMNLLKKNGREEVHNLGNFARAKKILAGRPR